MQQTGSRIASCLLFQGRVKGLFSKLCRDFFKQSIHAIVFQRAVIADSLYSINTIDAQDICIPKFTLQPLAENSVRHARPLPGEDLCIRIRAWKEEGKALIEVHDNGRECDAQELNRHIRYEKTDLQVSGGFGIRNVDERISLWYNGGSGLVYHNEKDGTLTVRIILDITQKKTEPDNLGLPVTAGGKAEE